MQRKMPLIGTILVKERLISDQQLDQALHRQALLKAQGKIVPIGQVLIDQKAITEAQIRRCLAIQQEISVLKSEGDKLGMRLLEAGLVTPSQLQVGLADHRATGMRIGEAMVARGFIDEVVLERFIRQMALKRLPGPGRPQT